MSEAPERIFVKLSTAASNWLHTPSLNRTPRIEYVRKDLYDAQAAEIAEIKAKVEALTGALAIEAAAIRIAKYQHPNSRWPKDEKDTISNRSGVYPVTWCFANKCRNIARAALTPEGE